jgi:hypothetical protein
VTGERFRSTPQVADGRAAIAEIYRRCDILKDAGWQRSHVVTQVAEDGELLPIHAYFSSRSVDHVLISGIHGTEPAGPMAVAAYVEKLLDLGRDRAILLLPLLNPWGYAEHVRYGPGGQSVSDCDHVLGRAAAAACPEAEAIARFVLEGIQIRDGAAVLDLHEDPVYEAPSYHLEGFGSYLYVSGEGALEHPITKRVIDRLGGGAMPLIRDGTTRFGERLVDGVVVDTEDGSIDEMLAKTRDCSPVITTELILRAPATPPLSSRVATYLDVLDAFFG